MGCRRSRGGRQAGTAGEGTGALGGGWVRFEVRQMRGFVSTSKQRKRTEKGRRERKKTQPREARTEERDVMQGGQETAKSGRGREGTRRPGGKGKGGEERREPARRERRGRGDDHRRPEIKGPRTSCAIGDDGR